MIKFPKSFWAIAEQIGQARSVVNQKILENNPRFDRGEKNNHVDTIGILGELIVMDYLTRKDQKFEMAKLLDFYPSKNPDFVIRKKRIDVKASKHSHYKDLLVNEEAHKKGVGKIDIYWFVEILDQESCNFYFIDYNNVSGWNCKLMKYTRAYYRNINDLK